MPLDALVATVVSVTPTRVLIRMPAHAPATVGFSITNPDAQVAWAPSVFTYVNAGVLAPWSGTALPHPTGEERDE